MEMQEEWDPMDQHYQDENLNKYDVQPGDKGKSGRSLKQLQYPYLVIKKKNTFVTETLLRNFFGDEYIFDIEYLVNSRIFFVYFHNIGSIEEAWRKIRQFPNVVSCVQGRTKQEQSILPFPLDQTNDDGKPEVEAANEPDAIDLISRTFHVSEKQNKHPEFLKTPLVVKSDYTTKGSMLAANDPSRRLLNVKYDFMLERYGAYIIKDIVEKDQAVKHFRSGRLIITSSSQSPVKSEASGLESKLAQQHVNKCLACNCYTDNSCRFCQMPFCNPACFDQLAAAHKESCAKGIPPMMDNTIVQKFTLAKLPPSGSIVKITAFEQSNVLYVRSADINADVAYNKVLSDVMMLGKKASPLTTLPQCGQLVIYKFDLQIVRAMVLNVDNPQAIYVVSVDYGSVEFTTLDTLYECSEYLASLPRYAVPVLLRGVPRRFIGPNLRDMLYDLDQTFSFVMTYSKHEFDHNKGMQRVLLIETEMNRSLNRLVKTIITPVEPSFSETGFGEDYLIHMKFPTGKDINVVIMDNTFLKFGVVHCTTLDYAFEITQMQRDIQYYGDSVAKIEFYAPPKNDLCIAKYRNKWCRGLCMELVGDGYPSILFIDYGNILPIHINDIRPYPPQFTFPLLTIEFNLLDIPTTINDDQLASLEKHLAISSIVKCDEIIHNEAEDIYALRINSVQKCLV